MIRRSFRNFSKDVVLKLYKSLVRPLLEYTVQAWRPHLHKDIELLERVQRRATKMIVEVKDKSYEERLKLLHMTTLETRRIGDDLIETIKIIKGFNDIDRNSFFVMADTDIDSRGHEYKLFKQYCNLDVRKFAFSNRIVNCGVVYLRM